MVERSVLDFSLRRQVLWRVDGRHHPLDGEEGGQVSRVRRDEDQGEEPPHAAHYSARYRSGEDHTEKSIQLFFQPLEYIVWS